MGPAGPQARNWRTSMFVGDSIRYDSLVREHKSSDIAGGLHVLVQISPETGHCKAQMCHQEAPRVLNLTKIVYHYRIISPLHAQSGVTICTL